MTKGLKKEVQLTFDHFCINITFILNQLFWKEMDKHQGKIPEIS